MPSIMRSTLRWLTARLSIIALLSAHVSQPDVITGKIVCTVFYCDEVQSIFQFLVMFIQVLQNVLNQSVHPLNLHVTQDKEQSI